MVAPEDLFRVGINAARSGAPLHQKGEVKADYQHNQCADRHCDDRACGACDRQERRAGHDKRAPSDHAAECHRPDIQL